MTVAVVGMQKRKHLGTDEKQLKVERGAIHMSKVIRKEQAHSMSACGNGDPRLLGG